MINFCVGPVESNDEVLEIGSKSAPYFRTKEFSDIVLESEKLFLKFIKAEKNARALFMTGSGSFSMEASVINTLNENDKALIVNGGSFGARFVEILKIHNIPYDEIKLDYGKPLTNNILKEYEGKGYTSFLVNVCDTSTGIHYDMDLISDFCKRNKLFLICDLVSSFLSDPFDMEDLGCDVVITSSQKALACPPGLSIIALSQVALNRIKNIKTTSLYMDLKSALLNGERGQTPFTPSVTIILQVHSRLKEIENNGGVSSETSKIVELAKYFRERIKDYPFEIFTPYLSNVVTPLKPIGNVSAYDIFTTLKDEYNIWVCPNGGDLKDKVFRVGHIGNLTTKDYDKLFDALDDMKKRNLL